MTGPLEVIKQVWNIKYNSQFTVACFKYLNSHCFLTFWRPRRRAYRVVDLKVPIVMLHGIDFSRNNVALNIVPCKHHLTLFFFQLHFERGQSQEDIDKMKDDYGKRRLHARLIDPIILITIHADYRHMIVIWLFLNFKVSQNQDQFAHLINQIKGRARKKNDNTQLGEKSGEVLGRSHAHAQWHAHVNIFPC